MVYNREEVATRAEQANGRPNTPGMCQAWTRGIIGVHAVGDFDGDGDADAVDGWKSEPEHARHIDRNPPRGVPVAWSGGSRGFGHRAISLGNGRIASTDAGGLGRIAIVPLDWPDRNWGMTYLGWSETMSGVPIPVPTPAKPEPEFAELEVLSWNVNDLQDADDVRRELTKMIDRWNPDVIYLYEATGLFGSLSGLGYTVLQLKPRLASRRRVNHKSNIVAMVRNGVEIKESRVFKMLESWKTSDPKVTNSPRSYRFIKVKKQGILWKVGGVHFPFGREARRESKQFVRSMIKVTKTGRPVIVVGDYTMDKSLVEKKIATPTDSEVAGEKSDLAVYENCKLVQDHTLGKHGSDHPVWRYVFKKRRKTKR